MTHSQEQTARTTRAASHPRRGAAGFTLIEVLLAITVTSFVMLAVGTTFRVTLDARYVLEEISESTAAGPRILGLIERDLRGLWTYNVKDNKVLLGTNSDVSGFEADRINLLTTTDAIGYVLDDHNEPVHPTLCEVGYWLKPNNRYRDLIELWRREDPMLDDDIRTQGRFQLVHDRIKSFKISYYKSLGYEAEEFHEWDSSIEDSLPRRIKIEFTLERKRGSRNVVDDAEVADFEGAEKTYVRHIVFDRRLEDVLRANVAMIPTAPGEPSANGEGGGGAGEGETAEGITGNFTVSEGGDKGEASGAGRGRGDGAGRNTAVGPRQGPGGRGQPLPPGPVHPNGFSLADLLRNNLIGPGSGGGGGFFGGNR
ncbi:MAG: prepilin-type N-terminal cleavage/methylation domain-containing protein [Planctomycetota bacterium]|nr:prepilin-type N-terminal cleavage/methylation domain-containing protein [Planctomycetota bacterium]